MNDSVYGATNNFTGLLLIKAKATLLINQRSLPVPEAVEKMPAMAEYFAKELFKLAKVNNIPQPEWNEEKYEWVWAGIHFPCHLRT